MGSLPCSSVHGILQAKIIEWVVKLSSRESSWPRLNPGLLYCSRFFTTEPPGKPWRGGSVQSLSHVLLWDLMNCSTPGFPILHCLLEFVQTRVHRVSDAIQPSHPLSPLYPPALNLSQHQGLFHWVNSSHQVAKVLELQLQHQPFQWIFQIDFL